MSRKKTSLAVGLMLKPKYIEQLPAAMVELYSEVEQDILADMARRIAHTITGFLRLSISGKP